MNGEIGFSGVLSGDISAGGGGGEVPTIYADATVDNNTGTPTVTVTKSTTSTSNTFHFAFQNLKGEAGSQGSQGIQGIQGIQGPVGPQGPRGFTGQTGSAGPAGSDGYSPEVTVTSITGGHRVNITDESHPLGQNFDVMDGINGQDGSPGETGPEGPAGPGVPSGGVRFQYLMKSGDADYLTEWSNLPVVAAEDVTYDNTDSGLTAENVQAAIDENAGDIATINASLTQKQDKIINDNFSGTTDSAGNIKLQGVSTTNHLILRVVSTSGYCTQCSVSGTDYYVKVLGNTNPITPVANTNTTIYFSYIEV